MTQTSILVVDHDEPTREMIAFVLSEMVREVSTRPPGVTAAEIRALGPSLVILELSPRARTRMVATIEELLDDPGAERLPIIVTSTDPQLPRYLAQLKHGERCHILQKPFDLEDLIRCVEQALGPGGEIRSI
jgi:DNA-binding NtrC family response regulator